MSKGWGLSVETATVSGTWWYKPLRDLAINIVWAYAGRTGSVKLHIVTRKDRNMAGNRTKRQEVLSFAEKLLLAQKQQEGRPVEATDEEFEAAYPQLLDLLTRKLQDGKRKIDPASLIFFCRGGTWKAMVSHKGLKVRWNAEGSTFAGSLAALERAVKQEEGQETAGSDPQP